MNPANHAVRRSFNPLTTPSLTFQMVLNLGKDQKDGRCWWEEQGRWMVLAVMWRGQGSIA